MSVFARILNKWCWSVNSTFISLFSSRQRIVTYFQSNAINFFEWKTLLTDTFFYIFLFGQKMTVIIDDQDCYVWLCLFVIVMFGITFQWSKRLKIVYPLQRINPELNCDTKNKKWIQGFPKIPTPNKEWLTFWLGWMHIEARMKLCHLAPY